MCNDVNIIFVYKVHVIQKHIIGKEMKVENCNSIQLYVFYIGLNKKLRSWGCHLKASNSHTTKGIYTCI